MLLPNIYAELYHLFSSKKWTKIDNNEIVFERFCNLASNLSEEQMRFVLELTEEYRWVSNSEYQKILSKLLRQLSAINHDIKKYYVFPIIKPEDEQKNKSGNVISYILKAVKPFVTECDKIDFKELTRFEEIHSGKFKLKKNEMLLLVDDFVGSGETIKSCVKEVLKNRTITNQKIIVSTIMIQQPSMDFLDKEKIRYIFEAIAKKGISNKYSGKELKAKVKLMLAIEKLIPGGRNFSFGYEESEALVTMLRTPDNTFPIFWKEHRSGREKFKAPFSRY